MDANEIRKRGNRAGNILIARVLVTTVLSLLSELISKPEDVQKILLTVAGKFLITIIIADILAMALKKDNLKQAKIFYIVFSALYVVNLYFIRNVYDSILPGLLTAAVIVLGLISLYKLGTTGKYCCYAASGLTAVTLVLSVFMTETTFVDYIHLMFDAVFYVLLGFYVEAKGTYVEEYTIEMPQETTPEQNKYDELTTLKKLMDNGVITPAEYEAKKKQILGL